MQLYECEPAQNTFRKDVMQGLGQQPKSLPSKYFYDETGSALFEQICSLDDYYVTRTELQIMQDNIGEMTALLGPRCLLIEYGSGSSTKTRMLLDHLPQPAGYVPIDISREQLYASVLTLHERYPQLELFPVCTDYTNDFELPEPRGEVARKVVYYPGSTIGNFDPGEAQAFLHRIAGICRGDGGLLIGVDLKKDFALLHRAYNDRDGVTAQFNLHLLERINQELGADFQREHFNHYAFYNPEAGRIEMHLVSLQEQAVRIEQMPIHFKRAESIWTENSYKYSLDEFARLAAGAGFTVRRIWLDKEALFSVQYLSVD
ncbi:L-histidine N(alpha)-methyltransferase [Tengunoibacter tsumagoiensis]|uniref:L-histidine N(alpha)-methyltransferase n=1 Tax=Tengunoibacter tsumagoiensis TaxID=2014871 RepID=UPI001FE9C479|nr:L-histidine N(alpha)-methyltransferase [Tengunoibacter tsumagoiensis]